MSKLSEQANKALTSNVELKKLLEQKGVEVINDGGFYKFLTGRTEKVWNGFTLKDDVLYVHKNGEWEARKPFGRRGVVVNIEDEMDKKLQELKQLNENIQRREQEIKQHHEKGMYYLEQAWQNDQNILNDLRNKNQSGYAQKVQNKNTGLQNFL